MSTGYHAVCHPCRKTAVVAVRHAGCTRFTGQPTPNTDDAGAQFLVEHAACGVTVVHEDHVPEGYTETVDIVGEATGDGSRIEIPEWLRR